MTAFWQGFYGTLGVISALVFLALVGLVTVGAFLLYLLSS